MSCVLFSVNLLKAVRREEGQLETNYGEISRLTASSDRLEGGAAMVYNTFDSYDELDRDNTVEAQSASNGRSELTDESLDEEVDLLLAEESEMSLLEGALRNFTDYLQVW